VVIRFAVDQGDVATWNSSHRASEAIVDAHLQPSNVKVVEIAVQWCVTIVCHKMLVVFLTESLAEEVAYMSEDDQDEVADIRRKEVVIWWFVLNRLGKLFTSEST